MPDDVLIIDDSTDLTKLRSQNPAGYVARPYDREPVGVHGFAAPFTLPTIPRSEWQDRIRQMEQDRSRISDIVEDLYGVEPLNQGQTNYCWVNGVVDAVQIIRLL